MSRHDDAVPIRVPLKLGILNIIAGNNTKREALTTAVTLARWTEDLGYFRYWLAEHHAPWAAHSSPEMLVPVIAAATSVIRVGTAGILLRYYTPIKIADQFMTLAKLFPDRIELGVTWGPGVISEGVAQTLAGVSSELLTREQFGQNVTKLAKFVKDCRELSFWVLGSSQASQQLAISCHANFGLSLLGHTDASCGAQLMNEHRIRIPVRGQAIAITINCCDYPRHQIFDADWRSPPVTVSGNMAECVTEIQRLASVYKTTEVVIVHASNNSAEEDVKLYEGLARKLT